ncbi:MAG: CRISPR-associated endonuclease Cas1 [Crocinitomicaceae bacterium]
MQLYIDTIHTKLSVKNGTFLISNKSTKRLISPRRVTSIAILTNVLINSAAIKLAAKSEIPIFYFDRTGNLITQLRGPSFLKQSRLRYQQILFMHSDHGKSWVIEQLGLKTDLQSQSLKRYANDLTDVKPRLEELSGLMQKNKIQLLETDFNQLNLSNTLMGIEGGIARLYFQGLNLILPEMYRFQKRSRQPAKDYFNASLNYLYGITYGEITKAIHATGLDTFVGALHKTPYKENLVFDCIESFRPIVDRLLIEICREELLNDTHFKVVKNGIWLSRSGKRRIIEKYNEYLHQRIRFQGKVRTIQHHMYAHVKDLKERINNFEAHVPDHL